jgi:hypothetical protein
MPPDQIPESGNSRVMRQTFVLLFFLGLVLSPASAAVCERKNHPGVIALYVSEATDSDSAAERWVSEFRELMRRSAPYCLVKQKEEAALALSVLGKDADLSGSSTAISIAVYAVKDDRFLDHWMYIAGKESLESSAQKAFATLDQEAKDLKKLRLIK